MPLALKSVWSSPPTVTLGLALALDLSLALALEMTITAALSLPLGLTLAAVAVCPPALSVTARLEMAHLPPLVLERLDSGLCASGRGVC